MKNETEVRMAIQTSHSYTACTSLLLRFIYTYDKLSTSC